MKKQFNISAIGGASLLCLVWAFVTSIVIYTMSLEMVLN